MWGGWANSDVGVMSVIVLVIGVVVTGLGLAALGFAIPIIELSLGATLVTAGTIAFCSGLILIGLSAAVAELRRVGDLLRARPMRRGGERSRRWRPPPRRLQPTVSMPTAPSPTAAGACRASPHRPSLGPIPAPAAHPQAASDRSRTSAPVTASQRPAPPPARQRLEMPVAHDQRHPEPAPASNSDVSAAAIERLRSSMTRTERSASGARDGAGRGGGAAVAQRRARPGAGAAPGRRAHRLNRDCRRTTGSAAGPPRPPRPRGSISCSGRARRRHRARSQSEPNWTPGQTARGGPEAAVQSRYADAGRPASPPPAAAAQPAAAGRADRSRQPSEPRPRDLGASAAQPSGTVLKSGVVDGMAYTLYTDGSIEANLPDGTVRFNSIADLRAHIEKHP